MTFKLKSFPKIQFFLIIVVSVLLSCQSEPKNIIDNEQFIEIYSRLLIIHEMEINKEYHDRLIQELFDNYHVTSADVDSTVNYLNKHPENWLYILSKVKDRINEIKKKMTPQASKTSEADKNQVKTPEIRKDKKGKPRKTDDQRRLKDQLKQRIKRERKPITDRKD